EVGAHGFAVCPELADFDPVSFGNIVGQVERPLHGIHAVAGRPEQAELGYVRREGTPRAYRFDRKNKSRRTGIEQSAVGTVIEVQRVAFTQLDTNDHRTA